MRTWLMALTCACLVLGASCGGAPSSDEEAEREEEGGEADLSITNSGWPANVTGDDIRVSIALLGGCDGPYDVALINGALPPGLAIDDASVPDAAGTIRHGHHLVGILCESGTFDFTLRVTDLGCSFPKVASRQWIWTINAGPLRIVKAVPELVKFADLPVVTKWLDLDALPTAQTGTLTQVRLGPTGGQGPYSVQFIDDPADPDDVVPPLPGVGIQAGTTVFGGTAPAPSGNRPYRLSFLVTDALNDTCICKLQWQVDP